MCYVIDICYDQIVKYSTIHNIIIQCLIRKIEISQLLITFRCQFEEKQIFSSLIYKYINNGIVVVLSIHLF